MEILQVEILNPKVRGILQELAELKLIKTQSAPAPKDRFDDLLQKIRSIDPKGVSEDEITYETEGVRSRRYDNKEKE